MKTFQLSTLTLALLLATSSSLYAKNYTIVGGASDGQYTRTICPAVAAAMKERGFYVTCKPGPGAGGNFALVAQGKAAAGLAQKDVLSDLMANADHPEYDWFLPIGDLAPEALWMVVRNPDKGGRLSSFNTLLSAGDDADASQKPFVIGIAGSKSSGSWLTFTQVLARSLPELKKNIDSGRVVIKPLGKMSPAVAYSYLGRKLDAVFFVMMPNPENIRLKMVVDSDQQLGFLPIDNEVLLQRSLLGQPVYEASDIPLDNTINKIGQRLNNAWQTLMGRKIDASGTSVSVKTLMTQATLVVNPETVDQPFISALTEVAHARGLIPDDTAAGKAARWWNNVRRAATALTQGH